MDQEQERALLLGFLEGERGHVLGILEGLSEEQLRRPVLPSRWSCLGMVKHLALADEHCGRRSVSSQDGRSSSLSSASMST
jgi:Protein of unknown function (DUF664)